MDRERAPLAPSSLLTFRLGVSYIQEAVHNSVSGSFVFSKYNDHNRPGPLSPSLSFSVRAGIQLLGEVACIRMPLIAQVAQLAFSSGNWSGPVARCAMHLGFIDLGTWKLAVRSDGESRSSSTASSPFVLAFSFGKIRAARGKMAGEIYARREAGG